VKELFEQVVKGRAFEYAVIPTAAINFSDELIKMCEKNVCRKYNSCWTCPPVIDPPEKQKEKIISFSSAFVFTTKTDLEDPFDFEGMMAGEEIHNGLTGELHEKFGKTNPVFGAGGCKICETCAFPEPCRFPEKIYPSLEATGINVSELSRSGGLRYNNGDATVTYFSMILFNE